MFNFRNDYSAIAHELVLEGILKASKEKNIGYGLDCHSDNAKKLILEKIKKDADIFFLAGGTQTNMVVISTILKPYEAVIAVKSGHIAVHETGAIEGQGHKILTVEGKDGKIRPFEIEDMVLYHCDNHMVLPRMVYLSNTTELGTVYNKNELLEIKKMCDKYNLYLFLDGARLASALASSDLGYEDIASIVDVFYIGGTKNGGLFGEALVILNKSLSVNFDYAIKHYGALLAKGFVTGIVFEVLMKDDLYLNIGKDLNGKANLLANGLKNLGVKFLCDSVTNQIFPIFSNEVIARLKAVSSFEIIEKVDENNTCIRFVTGFETTVNEINEFINYLKNNI